jgi:hypothetical protein
MELTKNFYEVEREEGQGMRFGGGGGRAKILWLNSGGPDSSGLSQKFSSGMGNLCRTVVTSHSSHILFSSGR